MKSRFVSKIPIVGRVRCCLELIKLQSLKGKTIADIGSSFGWLERQLAKSGAKLIGIEPDPEAVSFAKNKSGKDATFRVGSALEIPLKDKSADIAVFFDVIEHVPAGTEKKALKEINRTLKTKGVLLLTTPNSHWFADIMDPAWYLGHRHYTYTQIEHLLRSSGFEVKSHIVRGRWTSVIYMTWFYFTKWVLSVKHPKNKWLEERDDKSYNLRNGFVTHYIEGVKND